MLNTCHKSNRTENISKIIENIPRSDDDAVSLENICSSALNNNPSCKYCLQTLIAFLQVFDVVSVKNNTDITIKAKSQSAIYFLRSLALYIRNNHKFSTNWDRRGVGDIKSIDHILSTGTHIVYLMEKRRTEEYKDYTPIRKEIVSQVIIKARIRGYRKSVYLMQYDSNAHQYQLIGGRRRSTENDPLTVMKREFREELPLNQLRYGIDYELKEIAKDLKIKKLSRTFGAYTEYNFTIYHATIKNNKLALGPNDKWISLNELLSGKTNDDVNIPNEIICKIDDVLGSGIEGLKDSINEIQKRKIIEIIKARIFEVVGIAIGIIALILSILFYYFE